MSSRLTEVIAKLHSLPAEGRQLIAVSRAEAEQIPPIEGVALISITGPARPPAQLAGYSRLLRLSFADIDFPDSVPARSAARLALGMSKADALAILEFAEGMPDEVHSLVIHCEGGISRSCGVALALREIYGYAAEDERLAHANLNVLRILLQAVKESGRDFRRQVRSCEGQ